MEANNLTALLRLKNVQQGTYIRRNRKKLRKTYANALLYHTGSVRNTCNTLGYGGTTHSGGCVYGVVSPFPV